MNTSIPTNIVFDIGNVLLPYDPWRAVDNIAQLSGRSRWVIGAYFYITRLWDRFDEGKFTKEAFHQRVCRDLRLSLSLPEFETGFSNMFWRNQKVIDLIPKLRQRFSLYVLSDNNPIHCEYCRQYGGFMNYFDDAVWSFIEGVRKPDQKIYEKVMTLSGGSPESHFFIDDKKKNIDGAIKAGMQAYQFKGEEALLKEFSARGMM